MRTVISWVLYFALAGIVLAGGSGCASSDQRDDESAGGTDEREVERGRGARPAGPRLARKDEQVRTVQLYRGTDERSLPIVSLGGSDQLALEFDLMTRDGRPVTVSFHHANREWERDLSPSRVLESYHTDNIVDYRSSQGTDVPYVHYTYRFPNDDIRFRISGNYILRVTERGRRDSVLVERPFFVTDGVGQLQLAAEPIRVPGQRQQSVRPIARYDPPSALQGNSFGYSVCFIRNGRLSDTRCQTRPILGHQPRLTFELDRKRAFAPITADYTVDLSALRSGREIERTDRSMVPLRVLLKPDYAQFSDQNPDVARNGQIVVRDALRGHANPHLTAEYVQTTFAFVPPGERPLSRRLRVAGSFSNMDPDRGTEMHWVSGRQRYEGELLLKQGYYQYFYETSDPLLREQRDRSQSRVQSTYTTFLYYEDPTQSTDRLLRIKSFQK